MVRRITRLALVALAVLVATGPSALVVAGVQTGTAASATYLEDTDSASETVVSSSTDDTTNETTDDVINETEGTVNETDETLNETTDETTNETDGTAENLTDADETGDDGTANTTAEIAAAADREIENATDSTTNSTGSATNTTDRVESVAALSDTTGGDITLFPAASSTLLDDATDAGDALDVESADGESTSGSGSDSDASDSNARSGDETTATDAAGSDRREASAPSDSSGRSPDRSLPDTTPSGAEAAVSVGALTAAALFPQLADGFVLVGNVGGLSAASSTAAGSRSVGALRIKFDRLWRTATAFRYSRYDDSDPLAHETRAELHETVERSPGAYLSQICERADVAVSTARHHLDVLDDEGLVATAKVRGRRRYFPAHSDDLELAAALEDEEAAAVLRALARLGNSHGGRLADELDRDPSTVSHHLARLEDAGLVEREREGRAVVNRLAPEVARVLGGEELEGEGEADAEAPAVAD